MNCGRLGLRLAVLDGISVGTREHKLGSIVDYPASLSSVTLRHADAEARLRADLRWADLRWADLRWADLRWADLRWADLRWDGAYYWVHGGSSDVGDVIPLEVICSASARAPIPEEEADLNRQNPVAQRCSARR
jgi:hypothetical protein